MSSPAQVNLSQPVPLIGAKTNGLPVPKDRLEFCIFLLLQLHEKVNRLAGKFEQIEVVALEGEPVSAKLPD